MMLHRFIGTIALGLFHFGGPSSVAAQKTHDAGYVAEVSGSWLLGGQPLHQHQPVPERSVIQISDAAKGGKVTIARYDGPPFVAECCSGTKSLHSFKVDPLKVNGNVATLYSLIETVGKTFGRGPDIWTGTYSRGVEVALQSGIILLRDDGLHFTAESPRYPVKEAAYLKMTRMNRGQATSDTKTLQLNGGDYPVLKAAPGLTSGLYQFSVVVDGSGGLVTPSARAFALVAREPQYAKLAPRFREALDLVQSWQGLSQDERNTFLAASIYGFADEMSSARNAR